MNFLCIDELLDSGMDSVGVEAGLSILKKMNRDQGKNIMLISHKEELVGRVGNVLTVIKEGGFTAYNTDTEYVEWDDTCINYSTYRKHMALWAFG